MFTADNTSGFSNSDLKILNEVLEKLMADSDKSDIDGYAQWENSVSDAINNCWIDGMNAKDLEKSVRRAIGYHA